MRQSEIREWRLFLGASTDKDAASELFKLITRLDEAYDIVNYIARVLTGSPGGYADESLVVSRATLTEAIEHLNAVRQRMDAGDPEAA